MPLAKQKIKTKAGHYFFSLNNFFFISCVSILSVCMYVSHIHTLTAVARKGSPGGGSTDGHELP